MANKFYFFIYVVSSLQWFGWVRGITIFLFTIYGKISLSQVYVVSTAVRSPLSFSFSFAFLWESARDHTIVWQISLSVSNAQKGYLARASVNNTGIRIWRKLCDNSWGSWQNVKGASVRVLQEWWWGEHVFFFLFYFIFVNYKGRKYETRGGKQIRGEKKMFVKKLKILFLATERGREKIMRRKNDRIVETKKVLLILAEKKYYAK